MPNFCAGCRSKIISRLFITCIECNGPYDLPCAKIAEKKFNSMSVESKAKWKCAVCSKNSPRGQKIFSPPADPHVPEDTEFHDSISSQLDVRKDIGSITESTLTKMFETFKLDMAKIIQKTVSDVVTNKFQDITRQISEFRDSLSFISEQYDAVKKTLDSKIDIIDRLETVNTQLLSDVRILNQRLNLSEQYLRQNNIEISGIPEHRGENLTLYLQQLSQTTNTVLLEDDILQVMRVAKFDKDNGRPRTVVAKLRSPRLRDNLLAAVYNYNKKNPENRLNSHHLGIGGAKIPIYVSEHLTPANKSLHAEVRRKAKELNYKFVWVRNGRIYTRKNETSQALHVRNVDSLRNMSS